MNPGVIEHTLAPWGVDRSVKMRATKETNPFASDSAAVASGLDYFRKNCLMCHGAPGVPGTDFSMGLNPSAPSLDKGSKDTPDGELFWIIKHGIRMTPMPAFGPTRTDEEIWKLVAFIRHLPDLTAQERDTLGAAAKPVQPARSNP